MVVRFLLFSSQSSQSQGYMKEKVGPQLPYQVRDSFYKALETERMRSMPNSFLPPGANYQPGAFLLGDAWNMRHPLTGGGMTVCLWDVVHFTHFIKDVDDFTNDKMMQSIGKNLHWKRKERSSVINILAQALYSLFSAGNGKIYLKRVRLISRWVFGAITSRVFQVSQVRRSIYEYPDWFTRWVPFSLFVLNHLICKVDPVANDPRVSFLCSRCVRNVSHSFVCKMVHLSPNDHPIHPRFLEGVCCHSSSSLYRMSSLE